MHICWSKFQQFMANLNSESCHSLIGFLTPEYLGFLKLQVIPRFTGTCISPVPVNRNRGILTSLMWNWPYDWSGKRPQSGMCLSRAGQSGTLRYKISFGVYVLTLSPLFCRFYNTLWLLFVSSYNHLLFLAKTNKENDK